MKLVTHHLTGNSNVKAALGGFFEADILGEFNVTIATFPNSLLDQLGRIKYLSDVRRRSFDPRLKPYTKTWPWLEIGRIVAPKLGLSKLTSDDTKPLFVDVVVQNQDRKVASRLIELRRKGINYVYGYEDTTVHAFREAKKLGMQCLYDLPIGYWRTAHQLLETEYERWPDWISTMPGLKDSKLKLDRKDEELKLADRIFVASSFTASTLKDYPGTLAPVDVIPYGFPDVRELSRVYPTDLINRRLKVLFVGSLSQRKGIADLFAVADKLKAHVDLTIVGTKKTNDCKALNIALTKHKWIESLPHHEILKLMKEHDVLVFPSLFEGFGLVITEAMSQGTPVITTDRTAGPDLIKHGQDGWLIPAGSTEALYSALENLLVNPNLIKEIGREAMITAQRRPWSVYGKELAESIKKNCQY